MHRGLFSRFEGTSDGIAGDGGQEGGKASSCPFLPIPAPLRPVPSDSIAGPLKKKGEKFGN